MFIVEIDVDGVLADIHGGLNKEVCNIWPGFDGDTLITSWGMRELDDIDVRLRQIINGRFVDPEFIGNLEAFEGVSWGLDHLDNLLKRYGGKIVFNSHLSNYACLLARKEWINRIVKPLGISYDINLSHGGEKQLLDSYIIIEDHPKNLQRSNSDIKFMVRRGHNRYSGVSDLGNCKYGFVVKSFRQSVFAIEHLLWELRGGRVEEGDIDG